MSPLFGAFVSLRDAQELPFGQPPPPLAGDLAEMLTRDYLSRFSSPGRARRSCCWQRVPGPVPTTSQAMKTEKEEAVPTFPLGGKYAGEGAGCSEAALPGGPMPVVGTGGTPAQDLRPLKRRPVPGKHYQCSSYGCKLAFPSMQELMDHLKVHYRPTQSLE
ncbi:PREDICTED: zinc finger protein 414, partial [Merops nubicus]|uniref:zinc finger protein 414 n=1 Tax=Merops nubicus TaxID=57421 RepID=UPI0004F03BB4